MHCGDEELLAYLDGELPGVGRLRVSRHLKSCWPCRTRLAKCEEQIHRLNVAMDEEPFPDSEWVKDAKHRLGLRMAAIEPELVRSQASWSSGWLLRTAWAAAGVAVCFIGWLTWTKQRSVVRPTEVIERVAAVEQNLLSKPVHQTFVVEISEIRPSRRSLTTELEIWSDGSGGRYLSRLNSRGGALKQALWRRSSDAEFIYLPASAESRRRQVSHIEDSAPLTSIGDHGVEPAQIEAAFMRWLETRAWRPISFASQLSVWSGKEGTIAQAEQIRLNGGGRALRITAERRSERLVAIIALEVDSETYRPRLHKIRYEQSDRVVEFSLRPTAARTVAPSDVAAAMSGPDLNFPAPSSTPFPRPERDSAPIASRAPVLPQEELEALSQEIAAHYVLHLAGACLGEPVRVADESGTARVWRLNGDASAQGEGSGTQARLDTVMAVLSDMRVDASGDQDAAQPLAGVIRHARAIQRLSTRFPVARVAGLTEGPRTLLQSMVRDHATAVRSGLEAGCQLKSARTVRNAEKIPWQEAAFELNVALARISQANPQCEASERVFRAVQRALASTGEPVEHRQSKR